MRQFENYTPQTQQAMAYAREIALQFRHHMIGPEHLLLGIVKAGDGVLESLFACLRVDVVRLCQALGFVIGRGMERKNTDEPIWNAMAQAAFAYAEDEAARAGTHQVEPVHLLLGVLDDNESIAVGVLESFDITLLAVRQYLPFCISPTHEPHALFSQYQISYAETPFLNQVSRDLTAEALMGLLDPLVGRVAELEHMMQILSRRSKNNPVLIGHAGVGKTALVDGLAQRIVQGMVPENLQQMRVVVLDISLLNIGARFRGDFEKQLKLIMGEIERKRNVIVVIEELQIILGNRVTEGSINAANMFKPMLARGAFRCIGAITPEDYQKAMRRDPAFERRFLPVMVAETTSDETLEILAGLRSRYADYHQVTITDEALVAAVQLSDRYLPHRFQPDKALDLLDEAAARVGVHLTLVPDAVSGLRDAVLRTRQSKDRAIRLQDYPLALRRRNREISLGRKLYELEQEWRSLRTDEPLVVTASQISDVVAAWTGVPCGSITAGQAEYLLQLEADIHQRIVGQHEAVQFVAQAVRRAYAGIRDRRRPIGSFLFVGPTGVGKSELAHALASTLFRDEKALLVLDMSEFMEKQHVSRLLGSPPGYIGYDQGGQLTEFVRRHPHCILLFDEIEKAHPDVNNVLLQLLEDGRLTDACGSVVDCKNTLIILTSNLGTTHARPTPVAFAASSQAAQSTTAFLRERAFSMTRKFFRPELLQRIDEVIFFHPLEPVHLQKIIDLLLIGTKQRMAQKFIDLQVTDAARALLIDRGYESACGARALRRAVQSLLDDLLAEAVLDGSLLPHDQAIVDVDGDHLTVRVLAALELTEKADSSIWNM
jgi:ATP-dependent Clp protease ATP-binding subunit ClpC